MTASDTLARAMSYVDAMPPAIAGQGGHSATFKVAVKCAHGFGLDLDGVMAGLVRYNERCEPQWSEAELIHKARDALNAPRTQPDRYLLVNGRVGGPRPAPGPRRRPVATQAKPTNPRPWPELRRGRRAELESLAGLLGLPFDAVALAHDNGLVRFGINRGLTSWFVTDSAGEVCQARRMDGGPWRIGGGDVKADTIIRAPGAGRHLVGLPLATDYGALLLVEGGTDLLAAFALILGTTMPGDDLALCWDVCPVAMFGAGVRIADADLRPVRGKAAIVCYDDDETGRKQAGKRASELAGAGALPYKVTLPGGCNDLRDVVKSGGATELARAIRSALDLKGGCL